MGADAPLTKSTVEAPLTRSERHAPLTESGWQVDECSGCEIGSSSGPAGSATCERPRATRSTCTNTRKERQHRELERVHG
eukprot:1799873-Pleurochrysis_carterae.AAC.2